MYYWLFESLFEQYFATFVAMHKDIYSVSSLCEYRESVSICWKYMAYIEIAIL